MLGQNSGFSRKQQHVILEVLNKAGDFEPPQVQCSATGARGRSRRQVPAQRYDEARAAAEPVSAKDSTFFGSVSLSLSCCLFLWLAL